MNELIKINIFELTGGKSAISIEDGQLLFQRIDKAIQSQLNIELDFSNIEIITSTFLNSAIGNLYSKYSSDELKKHLKTRGLNDDDRELLIQVIENAKKYFALTEEQKEQIHSVLEE